MVIYYSGHGSWAPDANIDAIRTKDEARATPGDGFDEALVPWDVRDPHNPRQLLLDDEIGAMLDRLGTANVTMLLQDALKLGGSRPLVGRCRSTVAAAGNRA